MKCSTLAIFVTGCSLCISEKSEESSPRVNTPLGTIEGFYNTSSSDKKYEAYQGIPYATPPIGELRFELPVPISPWNGVLMAKKFGSSCIQYGAVASMQNTGNSVSDSEDCLYLNIYTPLRRNEEDRRPKKSVPVIFYIHGGAFRAGSGMYYGPKYLLNEDVILVTFNYRLGPLGFLSTEDDTVPGNMGLKDQVVALRWIHDNIGSFGGDPKQVTIVGQSAGGAAVQYHFLTNITSGLFRGGMSISGTALNCWTQTEAALYKAKKLSAIVGCPYENVKSMVDCLKTRDAHEIVKASGTFSPWLYNPISPFGPVVEKGGGEFTMIDRPPIDSIISGRVQDLPWMTSIVSQDGLFPAAEFVANATRLADLNQNWMRIGPELLDYIFTIPEMEQPKVSGRVRYHYLENRPIDNSTVKQMIQMVTDRLFGYSAEKAARLQARVMRNPVLFYYFSYRGAHSFSEYLSGSKENFGVSHIDDIAYVLDSYFDPTTTQRDREMQKRMIGIWISFATGGKMLKTGIRWPRTSRSTFKDFRYLHIAGPRLREITTDRSWNFGDKKFWNSLGFRENIIDPYEDDEDILFNYI
ncbi:venom carboxylesterase-6-like [Diprion similis]|uniref:venom carboxylesterase-6-like n=1 Tax=Diprion similis TaxID=362088 RepID=UPI001EF83C4F|nr:venom carboxylesterase-6-like [Diprion similis]